MGALQIAVNASGWASPGSFLDVSEEDLVQTMNTQFKGPFQFLQAVVAAMAKGGGGSIVQVSSATATILTRGYTAYMGTKAGIDHVIRAIANEYGAQGIKANSVSPGLTETPMTSGAFAVPGLPEAFAASYPLGRIGTSADIAAAVSWLATDECFMSGQNLQVNGGLTLRGNPGAEQLQHYMDRAAAKAGGGGS
jgi:2-hydroxycyclohexanecarboxyl-CoA dehydrogenase